MAAKTLKSEAIRFASNSIFDDFGKVFFYEDRVLRAIYSPDAAKYFSDILSSGWIGGLFEKGLVNTWVCKDIRLPEAPLILEHQRLSYELHPSEMTCRMFWLAAKKMVGVSGELAKHGFILKDPHPWNLMFFKGRPYYIDVGSIIKDEKLIVRWFPVFKRYFGVPIWLASSKKWYKLSREYRRQHMVGFGLEIFERPLLSNLVMRSLNRIEKLCDKPDIFFRELDKWLDEHRPVGVDKEYWAKYNQAHKTEDILSPKTLKQRFVYDVLAESKPGTVLDCAANKGFYSEMAARLGASVAAFDYEEHCVDTCFEHAGKEDLDITPVVMDFRLPTPPYGIGLSGGSAYDRFRSDVVLALGLAHHLCITQGLPVKVFCDICMKYAKSGVVLEYVDPTDKHVASWNRKIPADYSLESFVKYFAKAFPVVKKKKEMDEDGVVRVFVYLTKE